MDTVRLAAATDSANIIDLQLTNWRLTHPALAELINREDAQSQWEQSITSQSDKGRVLICERNGTLVGVAAVEFDREVGLLSLLEVEPLARRQLVGARLLNAAADIASQAGCLELSAWLSADHLGGRQFLESTGWVSTGATRTVSTHLWDEDPSDEGGELTEDQVEFTTSLAT